MRVLEGLFDTKARTPSVCNGLVSLQFTLRISYISSSTQIATQGEGKTDALYLCK